MVRLLKCCHDRTVWIRNFIIFLFLSSTTLNPIKAVRIFATRTTNLTRLWPLAKLFRPMFVVPLQISMIVINYWCTRSDGGGTSWLAQTVLPYKCRIHNVGTHASEFIGTYKHDPATSSVFDTKTYIMFLRRTPGNVWRSYRWKNVQKHCRIPTRVRGFRIEDIKKCIACRITTAMQTLYVDSYRLSKNKG